MVPRPRVPSRQHRERTATTHHRGTGSHRCQRPLRSGVPSLARASRENPPRSRSGRSRPATLSALVTDDLVGRDLEHVEAGTSSEIEDEHAGVIGLGIHSKGNNRTEDPSVEVSVTFEVCRERRDVVEPCGDRRRGIFVHVTDSRSRLTRSRPPRLGRYGAGMGASMSSFITEAVHAVLGGLEPGKYCQAMADQWRPPPSIPVGWYPHPGDATRLRYWDGYAWIDHSSLRAHPAPEPTRPPAWLIPNHVSGWAVASGYLGLVSLIFLGIPGPFAIATGILGLREVGRRPGLNGRVRAWVGIVFGTLGTALLVLVIVVLLDT